jgi:hypothetical protein
MYAFRCPFQIFSFTVSLLCDVQNHPSRACSASRVNATDKTWTRSGHSRQSSTTLIVMREGIFFVPEKSALLLVTVHQMGL